MNFRDVALSCFAAASVIHGAQVVLAAKLLRHQPGCDRTEAADGVLIGITTFFWQFGNFLAMISAADAISPGTTRVYHIRLFELGALLRDGSLVCFPLLFSYMCLHIPDEVTGPHVWLRVGRYLRYPLLPWTAFTFAGVILSDAGIRSRLIDPMVLRIVTLFIMLFYFVIFGAVSAAHRRAAQNSGGAALVRAHKVGVISSGFAVGTFVLMLTGYFHVRIPFLSYIELAAMLTSVPFTLAIAYRQFQFPFMDTFVREVIAGAILLAAFLSALFAGTTALWAAFCAIGLAYAKGPLTRWVDRTLMGHEETVEQQEERIGTAIRALTRLDDFAALVSGIVAGEVDAQWAEIGSTRNGNAVECLEIPGSDLFLAVGPRVGGRQYMSRELRVLRGAALQLAAHHQQLRQHEMRAVTARAQMRALQAQINPHFLFNTLNVLASLIQSDPEKAERITEELAGIFRYALESTRQEWVRLDEELSFLESYLDIEKARFGARLEYRINVDSEVRSLKIPPMILQPLVENAIKHGIGSKISGGKVRIEGRFYEDRVVLTIEDTGAGEKMSPRYRGTGIGLSNVRERLQHVYGAGGTLMLEEIAAGGTRATVVLPQMVGIES